MARCRGMHEILVVDEFNPHGAVVSCTRCSDTFFIHENTLHDRYYHATHTSPNGPAEDLDIFLLDSVLDNGESK